SAILTTSLSPVCGFEELTTPTPQATWSTRTQSPSPGRRKLGTMKLGWSQQVVVTHCGLPAQPGMPAHGAFGLPQPRQAGCSHVGGTSAAPIVNVVAMPSGNGNAIPSAVTHGVWRQVPVLPPQSASVSHAPNWFDTARAVQSFGPRIPDSWYVFAIGLPGTSGAQPGVQVAIIGFLFRYCVASFPVASAVGNFPQYVCEPLVRVAVTSETTGRGNAPPLSPRPNAFTLILQ